METKEINIIFYKNGLLKVNAPSGLEGQDLIDFCQEALESAEDTAVIDAMTDYNLAGINAYGRFDAGNLLVEKLENASTLDTLFETKTSKYFGDEEAIENLEYENKMMAAFLENIGCNEQQISDICNGGSSSLEAQKEYSLQREIESIALLEMDVFKLSKKGYYGEDIKAVREKAIKYLKENYQANAPFRKITNVIADFNKEHQLTPEIKL